MYEKKRDGGSTTVIGEIERLERERNQHFSSARALFDVDVSRPFIGATTPQHGSEWAKEVWREAEMAGR